MSACVSDPILVLSELFDVERCFLGGTVFVGAFIDANGIIQRNPAARDDGFTHPARVLRVYARDRQRPFLTTVSFDVKREGALPDVSVHKPRVRLAWGSEQGGGEATVDLRHGMRVALEASDITADVIYHVDTTGAILPRDVAAGPTLKVVSSLGFGSVGDQDLTLTEDTQSILAAAAGAGIQIPAYARSLEIQSNADPAAGAPNRYRVDILRGTVAGAAVLAIYDERDQPITLPNGGETVIINNLGPATQLYTPIFHLTL